MDMEFSPENSKTSLSQELGYSISPVSPLTSDFNLAKTSEVRNQRDLCELSLITVHGSISSMATGRNLRLCTRRLYPEMNG
jgi:hypothetical protein